VSIVVAAHDEEACLPELLQRLRAVLEHEVDAFEIIVVDDGSSDRTFEIVEDWAAIEPRVRGARLSRNEGHQAALLCGIGRALGDVVITLDADLQHPPERIPAMLAAWREGADVVNMQRAPELPSQMRDLAARGFYVVFNLLSSTTVSPGSTDFRLLDARCVTPLLSTPISARFLRAAVRRIGFRQVELGFEAAPRHAGRSSYTLRRLLELGIAAIIGTTNAVSVLPIVAGVALIAALIAMFVQGGWIVAVLLVVAAAGIALALASFGARAIAIERAKDPLFFVEREVGESMLAHRDAAPRGDVLH
jgi:glycosyltransferase involved in cell wall biosynthesis